MLEKGIWGSFAVADAAGEFKTGDYWTMAARVADASVEKLAAAPPRGIHRHYCRLAIITFPNTVADCRVFWPPRFDVPVDPRPSPAVHIRRVELMREELRNDSPVPVNSLVTGIQVTCDDAINPASVAQHIFAKPTCMLSIDMPFPSNRAEVEAWGDVPIGFRPLILAADVEARENIILWRPTRDTTNWLMSRLFQGLRNFGAFDRVLTRFSLNGNYIWANRERDEMIYLDGNAFGIGTPGAVDTQIRFPTGDGVAGGDFEMWFWLTPPQG
jgi:hypothetical protein